MMKNPCFNENVKSLIDEKNKAWRLYVRSKKKNFFFEKFSSLQIQLGDLIETRKQDYHFRFTENLEIETLVQRLTCHY